MILKRNVQSSKGQNKVQTAEGLQNGPVNSMVGKGESILNFNQGTGNVVNKGKVGVDNQKSSVQQNDDNTILGNDIDWNTGQSFAQQALPFTARLQAMNKMEKQIGRYGNKSSLSKTTSDLNKQEINKVKQPIMNRLKELSQRQQYQHAVVNAQTQNKVGYKTGKDYPILNYLPGIFDTTTGLAQYLRSKKETPYSSQSYAPNAYAGKALQTMAGLHTNTTPLLNQIYDSERRGNYSLNNQGGLTAGQRYIGRVAGAIGSGNSAANIYAQAQNQNNQYKAQYADMASKLGEQDAQNKEWSNQNASKMYADSNAAIWNYGQMGLRNMSTGLNSSIKNYNTWKNWQDTMNIYSKDQQLTRDQINAMNQAANGLYKSKTNYSFNPYRSMPNNNFQSNTNNMMNQFVKNPLGLNYFNMGGAS